MRRYFFPIFHNGGLQPDKGEQFGSPDLADEYGARVARDIDYDRGAGTVVIVVDASGAEVAQHVVGGVV